MKKRITSLVMVVLAFAAQAAMYDITAANIINYRTLTDGNVYRFVENIVFTETESSVSALKVADGATAYILIPAGVTVTLRGGNANGMAGAGAGIEVPANSKLCIYGGGTLNATGGDAAAGTNGTDGYGGYVDEDYITTVASGNGGNGGGGAGAGIGGTGGAGGAGMLGGATSFSEWDDAISGINGGYGSAGSNGTTCGTIEIVPSVTINANGGAAGSNGAGGNYGDWVVREGATYYWAAYGSGGGGGGGGGLAGVSIGTGGGGGGGGGAGGGGGTSYDVDVEDIFSFKKNGTGGEGGAGPNGTFGENGKARIGVWIYYDGDYYQTETYETSNTRSYPGGWGGGGGAAGAATIAQQPSSIPSPGSVDGVDVLLGVGDRWFYDLPNNTVHICANGQYSYSDNVQVTYDNVYPIILKGLAPNSTFAVTGLDGVSTLKTDNKGQIQNLYLANGNYNFTIGDIPVSLTVNNAGFTKMVEHLIPFEASYCDTNGVIKTVSALKRIVYNKIDEITIGGGNWYVFSSPTNNLFDNIIINKIIVDGTANIILNKNVSITVLNNICVSEGNTLNIYEGNSIIIIPEIDPSIISTPEQSISAQFNLDIKGAGGGAGIGGDNASSLVQDNRNNAGNITINGGTINVIGYSKCAGIGGGMKGDGGNITINGGTVTATGNLETAGIGGGNGGDGGNITINGGTVTAIGGGVGAGYFIIEQQKYGGAGIGSGREGNGGNIVINGGTVVATGAMNGAGIGIGSDGSYGTVTINGGTVTASCEYRNGYSGAVLGSVTLGKKVGVIEGYLGTGCPQAKIVEAVCNGGSVERDDNGVWVIKPNNNASTVTLTQLPNGATMAVQLGDYVVPQGAFMGWRNGGVFDLALNPQGEVTIDGKTIPVTPALDKTFNFQPSTFNSMASLTFQAIPGLKYELLRTEVLSNAFGGCGVSEIAQTTALTLTDPTPPPERAFYRIKVSK